MENRILAVSSMYNVEEWISRTINSVVNQDYENYKYILVDDISTDNTVSVAKSLTKDKNNVIIKTNVEKKYMRELKN